MRVQQQGQKLRLRIDEDELQALLNGIAVTNQIGWPDGTAITQRLTLGEANHWQRDAEGWTVQLAETPVRELAGRLPCKSGIEFERPVPGGDPLHILFDIDAKDSVRRRRK